MKYIIEMHMDFLASVVALRLYEHDIKTSS